MSVSQEIDGIVDGQTMASAFRDTVRSRPDDVALRWRRGDGWDELTWSSYAERTTRLASGLSAIGLGRGDRIVIMMRNVGEFHLVDTAAMLLGATAISIYNSSAPEQIQYLVDHSEAKVAVLEDVEFLERVRKVRAHLPGLESVVLLHGADELAPDGVVPFAQLEQSGAVDLDEAAAVAQPEDLATVIYTSGTTGPPKGVMLSHYNLRWTLESLSRCYGESIAGKRSVSYLPMAHIAERMVTHYQNIAFGTEVTCCPDLNELSAYLREVRPEVFLAVPRVWEKLYAGIQAALAGDAEKKAGFDEALEVGRSAAAARATGGSLSGELAEAWDQVDAAAFRQVRELVGLDQVSIAITGAAPTPPEVFDFFRAIGVPLSEIYGLSECSGPMTWERTKVQLGTVGRAIPGCDVRILDDGEVACRGGNVFQGYLKEPEKTAEVLDDDGWLYSGDIGELDDDGYLRIVDRKKELIITAGGKNISPANIEAALKSFPLIGQVCVIGDSRPYITALIVLDPEVAPAWARSHGVEGDLAELASHPEVEAEVARCVDEANQRFSQVEKVKRYRILGEEWLPDSEELTPTMKLKRRGIHARFAEEIEELYSPKG